MGGAARPLHDPGNHRSVERGSNLQAARRGGLMKPAKPAGERENTAALTPSLGTRSLCSLSCPLRDDGFARRDFHRFAIPVDPSAAVRAPLARTEGAGDEGDYQPDLPLARG